MKRWISGCLLSLAFLTGGQAAASDTSDLKITNFIFDEVEICDLQMNCSMMSTAKLPRAKKQPIPVLQVTEEFYLLFQHGDKQLMVHQSEVDLNKKATVTYSCSILSGDSDKSTYASMGLCGS